MPWSPLRPDIGLARLYAIEAIIEEAMPDLSQAFLSNPDTAYLRQKFGALDQRQVDIGDLEVMPPLAKGFLQIRVEGAGHREGLNSTSRMAYMANGTEEVFYTSVYGYLHDDAFRDEKKQLQARKRETALQILSGWLRARVLNYVGPLANGTLVNRRIIPLVSWERFPDGHLTGQGVQATDYLSDCIATEGHTGYFLRQFSGAVLYGIEMRHQGTIRG